MGGVDAPGDVSSLIKRQMSQLLAGLPSLACSSSLCIRNIEAFNLCPLCDGSCVSVSSVVMDPGRDGRNLGSTGLAT